MKKNSWLLSWVIFLNEPNIIASGIFYFYFKFFRFKISPLFVCLGLLNEQENWSHLIESVSSSLG